MASSHATILPHNMSDIEYFCYLSESIVKGKKYPFNMTESRNDFHAVMSDIRITNS